MAPSPVKDNEEGLEIDVKFGPSEGTAAQEADHCMLTDPRPKRPFVA